MSKPCNDSDRVKAQLKRELQLIQSNPLRSWDKLLALHDQHVELLARLTIGTALLALTKDFLNE
jgi:hypothetical protein